MKTFQAPTRDQVTPAVQGVFDHMQSAFGMVPNLYATIGYSENALTSYLAFQNAQAKGSFSAREREAVFLAVSQVNGCEYCLAAHTAIGKMNGFSDEDTVQLRAGTHADAKLGTITRLAASITKTHGHPSAQLLEDFFALGYGEKALIDLITLVADKTLANYVHNITQVPVDFPAAPALAAATV
ncbi:carboxymuconolactone decarboxylase family protein [Hymenobacter terricola]|uniref:carboxymuconolactone decarboxylase family protein n=1 Tax=Hymenobacter terricola TaxID=2819236 RepID=UPI001B317F3F|nr:carboxymuconolactone decarboxylase family protein [Hymenobacter terricola]